MSKAKPTMTPWREDGLCGGLVNIHAGDQHIAVVGDHREDGARALANAKFLVRAVNTHDALLAACVEAARHGRHADECGWWDCRHPQGLIHDGGVCDCWLSRLNAAIAQAESA